MGDGRHGKKETGEAHLKSHYTHYNRRLASNHQKPGNRNPRHQATILTAKANVSIFILDTRLPELQSNTLLLWSFATIYGNLLQQLWETQRLNYEQSQLPYHTIGCRWFKADQIYVGNHDIRRKETWEEVQGKSGRQKGQQ